MQVDYYEIRGETINGELFSGGRKNNKYFYHEGSQALPDDAMQSIDLILADIESDRTWRDYADFGNK